MSTTDGTITGSKLEVVNIGEGQYDVKQVADSTAAGASSLELTGSRLAFNHEIMTGTGVSGVIDPGTGEFSVSASALGSNLGSYVFNLKQGQFSINISLYIVHGGYKFFLDGNSLALQANLGFLFMDDLNEKFTLVRW